MKTILVLLSAYNGTQYIEEQIDSILHQEGVNVQLLVRDDGSTDGTQALLQTLQEQGLLRWYQGKNLRPAQSFLALLREAPPADFYALADQDDVWLPRKLRSAVAQLDSCPPSRPALYFGQTQPVDAQLNPLPYTPLTPLKTLGEALIHYFVGGNTMVLNHTLRQFVTQHRPQHIEMHDVYLYALALALGAQVVFDPQPYILYRQHGGNVVGSPKSNLWTPLRHRLRRICQRRELRWHLAQEIWTGYSSLLSPEEHALLHDFVRAKHHLPTRLALIGDQRLQCSQPSTHRLFQLALLLNTY